MGSEVKYRVAILETVTEVKFKVNMEVKCRVSYHSKSNNCLFPTTFVCSCVLCTCLPDLFMNLTSYSLPFFCCIAPLNPAKIEYLINCKEWQTFKILRGTFKEFQH
jgi:hypothetical protein